MSLEVAPILAAALSLSQPSSYGEQRACELHHGPIIALFESGSAQVTMRARAILDHFVWPYLHFRVDWPVNVVGYTGAVGSAAANRMLSLRRARAVRDYLVAGGIPRSRITVRAEGERSLAIETGDEASEPFNRRVWVGEAPSAEQLAQWHRECLARYRAANPPPASAPPSRPEPPGAPTAPAPAPRRRPGR